MKKFVYTNQHDKMDFGKFQGETLLQICLNHSAYIEECLMNVPNFFISGNLVQLIQKMKPDFCTKRDIIKILEKKATTSYWKELEENEE